MMARVMVNGKGYKARIMARNKARAMARIRAMLSFLLSSVAHRSRNTWNGGEGGPAYIHKFCSRMNF